MVNKNRQYGFNWERELVHIISEVSDDIKRNPGSGAYGTQAGIASLQGDVKFSVDGFHFLIEAKAGYGGSQSMSVKREWLDKTIGEARNQRPKRIPLLALKFKNSKTESGRLIAMTLDDFVKVLARINELLNEISAANDYIFSLKDKGIDISEYIKRDV